MTADTVKAHYGRAASDGAALARLVLEVMAEATGVDPARASHLDLAPFDNLHVGGAETTRELLALAALPAGAEVLDLGSGLGGPARILAAEGGVAVTGLDLTPTFVAAAAILSEAVGLADRTRFVEGSALDMPFADASFDAVWTQHMGMNIADKVGMFAEIARVLKPGGMLVLHDLTAGPAGPPLYPCPWANDASTSFLVSNAALRDLIAGAGLEELAWEDLSQALADWTQARRAERERLAAEGLPPPPGPHLLLGEDLIEAAGNLGRSLVAGRLASARGVWRKPAAAGSSSAGP